MISKNFAPTVFGRWFRYLCKYITIRSNFHDQDDFINILGGCKYNISR